MLKILFFFKLEYLKILKDVFEEDYLIVATEICHNFIFPFYSESFVMPSLNGRKVWMFEDLIKGPPFWYPQIFTYPQNYMCLA